MTAHSQITADPLEAIRVTLAGHRMALEGMLEANALADVDSTRRRILNNLDDRAELFMRLISVAEDDVANGFPAGALIMLNIHGGAPAIADIIRQSEQHRHSRRAAA